MKRQVISASVYCHGVKKKCRKAERHSLDLLEREVGAFDLARAEEESIEAIRLGMKTLTPGSRVFLTYHEATISEEVMDGVTFVSRTFGIASGKRLEITHRFPELAGAA